MKLRRREFLKRAATAGAAGGALAGCVRQTGEGPAVRTRPQVRWRLASSFPAGLDTIYGAAEQLAGRVVEITGGRFQIRVYPGGELVPQLQVLDAVQQGTVQAGHSAGYYYIGKNPAFAFDTSLPFGLTARQQFAWLYEDTGKELMRALYADFNIVNFPGGNTGAQMGGWFRREIGGLRDLKGLKMRIPGLGGQVMDRLGVSVQVLPGGEIFPALERGAIDATEWVGPYDDVKLGFHRVARHYYYPGWWEPGPALVFLVNRKAWDTLPADYQQAFEAAAAEASLQMLVRYDARNPTALRDVVNEGVALRPFPMEVLIAARDAFEEKVEELAAEDVQYARIYAAWKTFHDASVKWFGTTERAFLDFVSERR
jgi:TRAP-type mannitol/chloroaromatic compound transport system substrate-binding protein